MAQDKIILTILSGFSMKAYDVVTLSLKPSHRDDSNDGSQCMLYDENSLLVLNDPFLGH